MEIRRAERNVSVRDGVSRGTGNLLRAAGASDADGGAGGGCAGEVEHSAIGRIARTMQNDAAFSNAQRAVNFVRTRIQQHHATNTVRIRSQAADSVDGILDLR